MTWSELQYTIGLSCHVMVNKCERNIKDWWWKRLPLNSSNWKGKHVKIPSAWEAGAVSTTKNLFVIYQLFMGFHVINSVEHCSETLLQVRLSATPCKVTVTLSPSVENIDEVQYLIPSPVLHW